MPHFEFEIITSNNLKLYGQGWEPGDSIKAVACLVHGIGEHGGRYSHVAEAFNRAGYALIAFDLRGHGRSEGKRGHAPNYEALMSDISQLLETAKQRYPNLPVFLYGHSLGGNLAIHYALSQQPDLAGVVASAPLLRLAYKPPAWKTGMLRVMHLLRINCSIPRGVEDAALSRDINVVRTYRNDPLVHNRITPSLAVDMLRNGRWNLEHAAEFPCPLLLLHGDADRITSAQASREFADKAGASCTLKIWSGLYHELHNEPEQSHVLDTILEWLENKTGPCKARV
jgi:alpha-beta hydrolase superfamily lysophospholipase